MKEEKIIYFSEGEDGTEKLLEYVRDYALKNNIRNIVVASTTGKSAKKAVEILGEGFNLIVVTHVCWFKEGLKQEFEEEIREFLEQRGVKIVTAAHALRGVCRAMRGKYGGWTPLDLVADTLRIFCEGFKVCVEITLMAADSGCLPLGEEVIALAGTRSGLDTALVLLPATSANFFDLKVLKVLAKPI